MASLMFVIAFTGNASILSRPPDISSTLFFQSRNISWKMSFVAHPDWIFQVMVSAALGVVPPPTPAAGAAGAPPPPPGAVCRRRAGGEGPRAAGGGGLQKTRPRAGRGVDRWFLPFPPPPRAA